MRACKAIVTTLITALTVSWAQAAPEFVNGVLIPGNTLDATRETGANDGRFGFFSDLYYDPLRDDWWALSDRGPGGGLLDYATRLNLLDLKLDARTGAIRSMRVQRTIKFTDPFGLLSAPDNQSIGSARALNGLNPQGLSGNVAILGRSFDPEGLVVEPFTGRFIVADEYGPSLYLFSRSGVLLKVFETPENLKPRLADGVTLDYVSDRGVLRSGRQDNRGYEGLAISPNGLRLYTVLQDPLVNEPGPNNGRDGRNVRVVVFDNNPFSDSYGKSIAQHVYQLEAQSEVAARITAAGGVATANDPRQGRNIGLSAIVAINHHEFLVLERDNRGIGIDDPAGASVVGSKRIFKIDIEGATDVTNLLLPAGALPAGVVPVTKSSEVFIDLAANSVLPNGKRVEKWEGLAIGPALRRGGGARVIVTGNDNDYSVTQTGAGAQFDIFVDFAGNSVRRDLDQPTKLNGVEVGSVPDGFSLLPGTLHSYRVPAADLAGYDAPGLLFDGTR